MSELIQSLGIDWRLLLAQVINFLVLFWLLKRFAFKPLSEFLSRRSKKIEQGLADAEEVSIERDKLKTLRAKIVAEAEREAKDILTQARARSQEEMEAFVEKAERRKEELVLQARQEIAKEKVDALEGAKKEIARLVFLATEKVLQEKVDASRDRALVEKALKELR